MSQIYGIYNYGSDDSIFCGCRCSLYAYLDMKFSQIGPCGDSGQLNAVAREVHEIHQDIHSTVATKQDVECASHHIIHHVECARDEIVDKLDIFEKLYTECGDINQQVQEIHKHCCC